MAVIFDDLELMTDWIRLRAARFPMTEEVANRRDIRTMTVAADIIELCRGLNHPVAEQFQRLRKADGEDL